jgi:hypothetical protein
VSLENGCVCCSLRKDIVKWVLACSAGSSPLCILPSFASALPSINRLHAGHLRSWRSAAEAGTGQLTTSCWYVVAFSI